MSKTKAYGFFSLFLNNFLPTCSCEAWKCDGVHFGIWSGGDDHILGMCLFSPNILLYFLLHSHYCPICCTQFNKYITMKFLIQNSFIQVCFSVWLEPLNDWNDVYQRFFYGFVINSGCVWWQRIGNSIYIAHFPTKKLFISWHLNSDCRFISNQFDLTVRA